MTITFLQPDGVAITAQQERQGLAALYSGGAGRPLGGRSGFRVDTASTVLTATSTTWTLTPCAAMIDPGATTNQGMYGWATDANVTGSVTAADATYTRMDIVYILVNDSSAGDGSGATTANVLYLAGTPSATPVAPTVPPRGFLVGTITVPKVGGGSPTVALNPARFVAAGAPLPVSSQSERDALTKYDGLTVRRLDLAGRPTETWNAGTSAWRAPIDSTLPVVDSNWTFTGQLTRALGSSGNSTVTLAEQMVRTGSTFTLTTTYLTLLAGFAPAGWAPAATFNGWALLTASNDSALGNVWWRVTTAGDLQARLDSGSTSISAGVRFYLSGNWTTA